MEGYGPISGEIGISILGWVGYGGPKDMFL